MTRLANRPARDRVYAATGSSPRSVSAIARRTGLDPRSVRCVVSRQPDTYAVASGKVFRR